jgi:hypothetical protein
MKVGETYYHYSYAYDEIKKEEITKIVREHSKDGNCRIISINGKDPIAFEYHAKSKESLVKKLIDNENKKYEYQLKKWKSLLTK